MTSTATGLRSRTRVLDASADPLSALGAGGFAWFAEGFGLATSGVAARVRAADAAGVLAAVAGDDPLAEPGMGPLAVGALGWDGQGELVIPARITGRTAGGLCWVTEVGPADEGAEGWAAPALAPAGPPDRGAWNAAVDEALSRIGDGRLAKVVLAREVTVDLDRPLDVAGVLATLRHEQPACFTYAAGSYVGASPELLARRRSREVVSRPMAGTVAQGGTPGDDRRLVAAMAASAKEQAEHGLVVDDVRARLGAVSEHPATAQGPEVVRLSTVAHLATTVRCRLRDSTTSALDVAALLHPTPAVAGVPRTAALAAIAELEG
ncbi:MAG: chorismate-binding protein, partial [Acidimicrobiales bacterium]